MKYLFDLVSTRLGETWKVRKAPTARRAFACRCGRPIFFRNSQCLNCQAALGYWPEAGEVIAIEPAEGDSEMWQQAVSPGGVATDHRFRRCANFSTAAGCNWLVEAADRDGGEPQLLCRACRLNRTIPDLSIAENGVWWGRIEGAKRRLVSSLIALGLPVRSRNGEDPERGLQFDLLRSPDGGPPVLTGHDDGLITLNIEEADDAHREAARERFGEPYRTLLGHMRHEVGHYYWYRLIDGSRWHEPFREAFGDERVDYGEALKRYYGEGAPADWPVRHVSAYASAHAWEDWAETWAHYLHMVDTLDTAISFGIDADNVELTVEPFTLEAIGKPKDPGAQAFLSFVNAWVELTGVMNELSRSMGQADFYPFVLSAPAVAKLYFVHRVVSDAGAQPLPAPAPPAADMASAAPAGSGSAAAAPTRGRGTTDGAALAEATAGKATAGSGAAAGGAR